MTVTMEKKSHHHRKISWDSKVGPLIYACVSGKFEYNCRWGLKVDEVGFGAGVGGMRRWVFVNYSWRGVWLGSKTIRRRVFAGKGNWSVSRTFALVTNKHKKSKEL